MASIRKNKYGTWDAWIQRRGLKKIRRSFRTRTLAERWAAQVEADISTGRYEPEGVGAKRTLKEAIARYIKETLPRNVDATQSTNLCRLLWWSSRLGHLYLPKVTSPVVAEAKSALLTEGSGAEGKGPCSPTTARKYLQILERVFTVAIKEWHWIKKTPFSVEKPAPSAGREKFLTPEERERLLKACQEYGRTLYPVVLLLLYTGARYQEISRLKWKQIDLTNGTATLEAGMVKTRKARTLFFTGASLAMLQELYSARQAISEYVFPSPLDLSRPIGYMEKAWQKATRATGLQDLRIHDLRHCYASAMLAQGASLAELAELLGHSNFEMVKRYAHLDSGRLRERVKTMAAGAFGE